jgi:hypothetical protein
MATSIPQMKEKAKKAEVIMSETIAVSHKNDGVFFSFIERNRFVVMASPFCLAIVMILLKMYANPQVHTVIDFVTGISQK